MPLQPGEIIEGKYRIVRSIGEGGMGAVYEGENTRIKRRVAIKVLHAAVAEKTDVVRRFEREAQAAGTIGSEHIVEVLDLGSLPSGERFMVMEFLDGEDLTSRIKRKRRLSPGEAVQLISQVLDGLAAAHDAGIIHRDLKPDNIYVLRSRAGRADFVKILDFGVSKFSALDSEMSMTRTGAVMGTPYYMSPEQAKGGQIDQRSDLYAIGVVLYQAVTGRVPFNASSFNELLFKIALEAPEPIEQLVPNIPTSFAAIVTRAMQRDPAARFQSAREFRDTLNNWQMMAPPAQQPATEPLPAMPDLRTPAGGAQYGQSSPAMQPPGMAFGGGYPRAPAPRAPQPSIPGTLTPAAALAVTQAGLPPRKRSTALVVALVVVTVAIVAVGAAGVFVLVRKPHLASGPPADTASSSAPSAEPADTAVADENDDGTDEAASAEVADSAAPPDSAAPDSSAPPPESATPAVPTAPVATHRPSHTVPRPHPTKTAAPAASASAPAAKPTSTGRNIKVEL